MCSETCSPPPSPSPSEDSGGEPTLLQPERWEELHLKSFRTREADVDLIKPENQNTEGLEVSSRFSVTTKADLAEAVQKYLPLTPNLRTLSLSQECSAEEGNAWTQDPGEGLTIPSSLTNLCLSNIPPYPLFQRVRVLTVLKIHHLKFNLELDRLLDFLEQNDSLESAHLTIQFALPSLRDSQRPDRRIKNRLKYLNVSSECAMDIEALISKIPVQKGANLEVFHNNPEARWKDIPSLAARLLDLRLPAFMGYCPNDWGYTIIQLAGPDGHSIFRRCRYPGGDVPFIELPSHPFDKIQTFYLKYSGPDPTTELPLSSFHALETLIVEGGKNLSDLLSGLFSDPASTPSLKTLEFLHCDLDEEFIRRLIQFSKSRSLYRVSIVDSGGQHLLSTIDELRKHEPVVDAHLGEELP